MAKMLSQLRSTAAVQAALDEFARIGRTEFLSRYGFGRSRDFLVRDPKTGNLCDSKAIVGAAFGHQFPEQGHLTAEEFSGGEATVVPKLQSLGFEVVRIGEDWAEDEVDASVSSYFEMLAHEARQEPYNKAAFNAALRERLRSRSKAAVELKHQNISSVLQALGLPFIPGYKPRGNVQLLLRKSVQRFVHEHPDTAQQIVDAMEDVKSPAEKVFKAVLVEPPPLEVVAMADLGQHRIRLPRKVDFAARDEANRKLGRAGEQWAIEFEHRRLAADGQAELVERLDWVSDRLGDGAGYDILSYNAPGVPRYIEVKTTNGSFASSFIISRNELDFSQEVSDAFYLYRLFQFRQSPAMYMLRGNELVERLHLEPIDYRASFRKMLG